MAVQSVAQRCSHAVVILLVANIFGVEGERSALIGHERIVAAASTASGQDLIDIVQRQARLPGSGQFQDDFTLVVLKTDAKGAPIKDPKGEDVVDKNPDGSDKPFTITYAPDSAMSTAPGGFAIPAGSNKVP